ncbi:MAG: SusD/RagB family nutrient-binding outer membrane lipoprotein [Bacteroidales bacterium]|nr:SusD/RagB family nutrient-binding outer membrane lipoprotein [Bacteroidales bacterium]
MKKIFRLLSSALVLSIVAFSFASCSEDKMDEINFDKDTPKDVQARFIIPDIELRTAQNIIGGDFNTYIGSYIEYWAGTHNQLYQAELRNAEVRVSSTFNNNWGTIFENIRNAKIVIAKTDPSTGTELAEATTPQCHAIGEVLLAVNLAVATDMFGDVPYTEVGSPYEIPFPKADSQQSIYTEILRLLDAAASEFAASPSSVGQYDFIYNGSNAKWLKLANGLRARYTMRLLNRSGSKNADLQKVIDYVDASFASEADNASIQYANTDNQNPMFDFEWSRDAISSCTSMWGKLWEREDPRMDRVYWHSGAWVHLDGESSFDYLAPTGEPEEGQGGYMYDIFAFSEWAPVHFMSYHEAQFLKAEAQARLGKTAEAKETLKEAVKGAFENLEVSIDGAMNAPSLNNYGGLDPIDVLSPAESDALAEEYFDAKVSDLFDENPLKEVMIQKYIGLWGANGESLETYADIRRLKAEGKDFYELINPGKFPLRCPYGNDDVVSNPNISPLYTDQGNYIFTENVWWAGGSR